MAAIRVITAAILALGMGAGLASAQVSGEGTVSLSAPAAVASPEASPRPKPRPLVAPSVTEPAETALEAPPQPAPAPVQETAAQPATEANPPAKVAKPVRDPSKGAVTNLPIPRYVSLKGNEGNARRGPSLTHRIDWVFSKSGMPLRVTAEHENWRRVEDAEGMGGWVHYALLSGVRSALVAAEIADFRMKPDPAAATVFQAERGVFGRLLECQPDWCRLNIQGEKGWVEKTALWGVDPGEVLQ